jgi:hypothetical protein
VEAGPAGHQLGGATRQSDTEISAMTTYADIKDFRFVGSKLQAPNHDELLLAENYEGVELLADDGDAIYSFPPDTTHQEILFYLAGEAQGARAPLQRRNVEFDIRAKLVELIRLSAQHGIPIESLMHDALDRCDPEGPFSR